MGYEDLFFKEVRIIFLYGLMYVLWNILFFLGNKFIYMLNIYIINYLL